MTYEEFCSARDAGEPIVELIRKEAVPRTTAYKWEKRRAPKPTASSAEETPDELEDEGEPLKVEARVEKPSKPKPRAKKEPITAATAGKLMEGMFMLAAILQNEEEWLLTPAERSALAQPLADSLEIIPNPIAKAINDYAAPMVFLSAVVGIVTTKQKRIAAKQRSKVVPMQQRPAPAAPSPASPSPAPAPVSQAVAREAVSKMAAMEDSKSQIEEAPSHGELIFS